MVFAANIRGSRLKHNASVLVGGHVSYLISDSNRNSTQQILRTGWILPAFVSKTGLTLHSATPESCKNKDYTMSCWVSYFAAARWGHGRLGEKAETLLFQLKSCFVIKLCHNMTDWTTWRIDELYTYWFDGTLFRSTQNTGNDGSRP